MNQRILIIGSAEDNEIIDTVWIDQHSRFHSSRIEIYIEQGWKEDPRLVIAVNNQVIVRIPSSELTSEWAEDIKPILKRDRDVQLS